MCVTGENQGGAEHSNPVLREPELALVPGRSCGTCSLCCKLLPIRELNKPAGQWCIHAVPGSGCNIHHDRPPTCRQFFCSWRLDPNLGPEWKPDVARFVLSADPARHALVLSVDPGMPLAWKREPYYGRLRQFAGRLFAENKRLLVDLRDKITVILPDRDVPIGLVGPGEEIAVWREGSTYGAALRQTPVRQAALQPDRPPPVEAGGTGASRGSSLDDPDFQKALFRDAFEQACKLLDDPEIDDLVALGSITRDRNQLLDEAAESAAKFGKAECRAGCASCCRLMVMATPFEALSIARHLLETRTPAELESIKARLRQIVDVPLDMTLRVKARLPCALLEDGRCSIYAERPSVCRITLSQSRAACDSCLDAGGGVVPSIVQPGKVAAFVQTGIDYALITRRNLSTELVEFSRALLIALSDHRGALTTWLAGDDPFPAAHVSVREGASSHDKAMAAARRFGVV
jgi:Fe-S-cluster containining protein